MNYIYDNLQLTLDKEKFYIIFYEILSKYENISYHSKFHGLDVLNNGIEFLKNSKMELNSLDYQTFIFGLLGHDIKHPGLTKIPKDYDLEYFHYLETKKILDNHKIKYNDELLKNIILSTKITLFDFKDDFENLAYLIKLADVNHTVSCFEKHLNWTWKLEEELGKSLSALEQVEFLEDYVKKILLRTKNTFNKTFYEDLEYKLSLNTDFWRKKLPKE